jgi:hypothetical protein
MKKMTVVAVAVLAGTGCVRGEPLTPPQAAAAGGETTVVLTEQPSRWRHDPYEFRSMSMSGDTLVVEVRYGGGCEQHDFTLLVMPIFMESYPVQMSGSLAHDAKGDMCRALVSSTLRFDLSPLRELYRQSYSVASDTLHLNVRDWPRRVVYRF